MTEGWKAFRTADARTSPPSDKRTGCRMHEESVQFPLNEKIDQCGAEPFWFCETKNDACIWALNLGYKFVAPVMAFGEIQRGENQGYLVFNKITATQLMRVGELEAVNPKKRDLARTARLYLDIDFIVDELKEDVHNTVWLNAARESIVLLALNSDISRLQRFASLLPTPEVFGLLIPVVNIFDGIFKQMCLNGEDTAQKEKGWSDTLDYLFINFYAFNRLAWHAPQVLNFSHTFLFFKEWFARTVHRFDRLKEKDFVKHCLPLVRWNLYVPPS